MTTIAWTGPDMIKRLIIAIIVLALLGVGVVGFNRFRDSAIEGFFANRSAPAVPVATVVAEPVEWVPALETIGTVYAARGIELAVEAGGVVREVNFKANDTVEEDQVLVRISDAVEQADKAAAEATVTLAKQSLDRATSLGKRGVAAESTVQEAQASLTSGTAQVQRIQAVIDQKNLKAPFGGEIGIPRIEVGQFVAAGTQVATLQDVTTLRVDFSVPEQELPRIAKGQAVRVLSEAGGEATGAITAIEPRIDPVTRLVAVRAELDNREGALSPGQFVRVRIWLPAQQGVIALPQTAVVTSLYGDYVYAVVAAEDGAKADDGQQTLVTKQVFVKTGSRQGPLVEMTDGIAAGDRIVTAGQNRLSNGVPVTLAADGEGATAVDGATTRAEDGKTQVDAAATPADAPANTVVASETDTAASADQPVEVTE